MTGEDCVISLSWGEVVGLPNGKLYKVRRLKYHGVSLTRVWREAPTGGESPSSRFRSPPLPAKREPKPVGERIKEMMG